MKSLNILKSLLNFYENKKAIADAYLIAKNLVTKNIK